MASMLTLLDYIETFQIQAESPGPLYESLHLLDTIESAQKALFNFFYIYFGLVKAFSGDNFGMFDLIFWLNQVNCTFKMTSHSPPPKNSNNNLLLGNFHHIT